MPEAKNLRQLLEIRDKNRDYLDSINDNLGTALGYKKYTDQSSPSNEPAILLFVPRKIEKKWLPPGQEIKKELKAGNLRCPVDVVEGRKFADTQLVIVDDYGKINEVSWSALRGLPEISEGANRLRERLRGWTEKLIPGAQLAAYDKAGDGYYGTLTCFARDAQGQLGFITNQHVADHVGNVLLFPDFNGKRAGVVSDVVDIIADEVRFPGIIDEPLAHYNLDCAFVRLGPDVKAADIDPRHANVTKSGRITMRKLGPPLDLDLDTMGPVGRRVIGIGRTMSFQRGTVWGFAYEFSDNSAPRRSLYTDLLVVGEDGVQFSAPGDSGKLIVTDDNARRPVGLLWGGWLERLRSTRGLEDWSYAVDINVVLNRLGATIET